MYGNRALPEQANNTYIHTLYIKSVIGREKLLPRGLSPQAGVGRMKQELAEKRETE